MREISAARDDDYWLQERKTSRPRKAGSNGKLSRASFFSVLSHALLRTIARRPKQFVLGFCFTTIATVIMLNALAWQQGPHPSPLWQGSDQNLALSKNSDAKNSDAKNTEKNLSTSSIAPLPPARPVADGQIAKPEIVRDNIADLLQKQEQPASQPIKIDTPRQISQAQRALVKLGYGPLKTDGVAGATTRQALEKFERDRHLPITGELSVRTMRELTLQSGLMIE